ncbi:MAG: SDR family NAD(P)-dependent oxidoreductase [Rhodospirillaceae bacterium]|jgi:NAD(P)-dependent dehydrogenase (short-subunit alcohol dehydrogenase family)|nr:SDR family NAD(P)-dependent oxidoreductase [Rhodospirillaceae bacterium]MDD9917016.1 SDR family NAD(P)-dependent oxidoreductase [Rhodospirillaceae bacterium]MDD9927420.1 SDR family NAD(P)-dependent oxidoreductase [Rhodospirillaceae bacterium]|tara:strand:- start:3660 stop:4442 length:783 start_codon:yes stop_codon:yes gene_type:complete
MRLENRIAIITGAAKGMGAAITRTLGREGADMMLAAREVAPLDEVAEEVRAMGRRVETISADVTDPKQVEAMVEATKAAFGGRIDILVNVAGTTGPIETPVQDIDPDDFLEVLDINVKGTFLPIKYTLPTMIAQKYGKIVNIGGSSGLRGYKYRTAYSSSKWALRGLTRTIALEAGPHNVNVNIVMPGIVHTPRMDKLCEEKARVRGWTFEQVYQEYVEEMCLGRVTEPEDVADAVLYCASDESKNMTGQKISVDGGWDV